MSSKISYLNELDCNDGFSWSFQQNSSITNVTHTGSRLALYVDQSTTVTDYRYTPGAQQCGARNGFWLTPPANNITIMGFTSSGEGGKVGIIGPAGVGKVARNVTIQGLTMTASGYTLTIGDVSNLLADRLQPWPQRHRHQCPGDRPGYRVSTAASGSWCEAGRQPRRCRSPSSNDLLRSGSVRSVRLA